MPRARNLGIPFEDVAGPLNAITERVLMDYYRLAAASP
jgi:hypothetical protein